MAPDTGKRISFQSDSRDSDSRISAEVCLLADEDIKWQRSRSAPYQRSKWTFKQAARAHIVFLLLFVATYASLFYFYGYEYAYGGPVLPSKSPVFNSKKKREMFRLMMLRRRPSKIRRPVHQKAH